MINYQFYYEFVQYIDILLIPRYSRQFGRHEHSADDAAGGRCVRVEWPEKVGHWCWSGPVAPSSS